MVTTSSARRGDGDGGLPAGAGDTGADFGDSDFSKANKFLPILKIWVPTHSLKDLLRKFRRNPEPHYRIQGYH